MSTFANDSLVLPPITDPAREANTPRQKLNADNSAFKESIPHGFLPPLGPNVYRTGYTPDELQLDRELRRQEKLAQRQYAFLYMQRGWNLWNDKLRNLRAYYMRLLNPEFEDDDIGLVFDNRGMIGAQGQVGIRGGLVGGTLRGHEGTDAIWTGTVEGRDTPSSLAFSEELP